MEKLKTIQTLGKLNDVYRTGERGPGGAYHTYTVARIEDEEENQASNPVVAIIRFQRGPRSAPDALTGVLDADLIEIVRDRLKCFQEGEFSTPENSCAIECLEHALHWMNRRVEDRIQRGVLGKNEK